MAKEKITIDKTTAVSPSETAGKIKLHQQIMCKSDVIAQYVDNAFRRERFDGLTAEDTELASESGANLIYGEIIPDSVSKLIHDERLCFSGFPEPVEGKVQHTCGSSEAKVVMDLGCGLGKIVVQVFLQCLNLEKVIGVDISPTRIKRSINVIRNVVYPDLCSQSEERSPLQEERKKFSVLPSCKKTPPSTKEFSRMLPQLKDLKQFSLYTDFEALSLEDREAASTKRKSPRIGVELQEELQCTDEALGNVISRRMRSLKVMCCNFHEAQIMEMLKEADIVFFMIDIERSTTNTRQIIDTLKPGARMISYRNLDIYKGVVSLGRVDLPCTWNYSGARIYLYRKICNCS